MNRKMLLSGAAAFVVATAWAGPAAVLTSAPAKTPPAAPAAPARTPPAEAPKPQAEYDAIVKAYMTGQWQDLADRLRTVGQIYAKLSQQQRMDITYIRQAAAQCRPAWWKNCRSSSAVSFPAELWGRRFIANYDPSPMLGVQFARLINNQLQIVVTWRPNFIDNPRAAEGELAKRHSFTQGDLGEAIVWHELGHNYVTAFLPLAHVIELYRNHSMLFNHLQEFYADMTSIYHASPRARRAMLMIRLPGLRANRESDGHSRAAHAVGALILSEVLADPAKWPGIHLPPAVPGEECELKTIIYVLENIDPKWSLAEDQALRTMVERFMRTTGEAVLRSRGTVTLKNKLSFKLVEPDDRDFQVQRNKWVSEQLTKAIKAGQADKKAPDAREPDVEVPW